jgi:hypothetical protein
LAQLVHASMPPSPWNQPPGHARHAVVEFESWSNRPAAHGEHVLAPLPASVSVSDLAAHCKHAEVPFAATNMPEAQGLQAICPIWSWKEPAEQG